MTRSVASIAREHRAKLASKGVRLRQSPGPGSEQYGRYRRAGVEGTYGAPRGRYSNAERTIYRGDLEESDGGGRGPLGRTARNVYRHALKSGGGKYDGRGDRALHER
jgi:hypothetical protein